MPSQCSRALLIVKKSGTVIAGMVVEDPFTSYLIGRVRWRLRADTPCDNS